MPNPRAIQKVHKATRPDKDQVECRVLAEAEHNADRALVGRRALAAAQTKSLLRGGFGTYEIPNLVMARLYNRLATKG